MSGVCEEDDVGTDPDMGVREEDEVCTAPDVGALAGVGKRSAPESAPGLFSLKDMGFLPLNWSSPSDATHRMRSRCFYQYIHLRNSCEELPQEAFDTSNAAGEFPGTSVEESTLMEKTHRVTG